MSEHTNTPMNAEDLAGLPAELRDVACRLNALASSDRAAAGDAFEQRLAAAVRPGALDQARVERLAHADREAASGSLEDRIFMATRGLLRRPDHAPAPQPFQIHVRSWRWTAQVAAAIVLVGASAMLYVMWPSSTASGPSSLSTPGVVELSKSLDDDFDDFARVMTVALGEATDSSSSTTSTSTTSELDSSDQILPRFDFSSTDLEGSL